MEEITINKKLKSAIFGLTASCMLALGSFMLADNTTEASDSDTCYTCQGDTECGSVAGIITLYGNAIVGPCDEIIE